MSNDTDPADDEARFRKNLEAFHSGYTHSSSSEPWPDQGSDQQANQLAWLSDELNKMLRDEPLSPFPLDLDMVPAERVELETHPSDWQAPDDVLAWRIETEPPSTPYDRAFVEVRRLESEVGKSDDTERPALMADLAEAKRKLKIELERSTDDEWRMRRAIDEWRQTEEGRAERNAKRRVRDEPNKSLADMSAEEKAAHKREQARLRKRRQREATKQLKAT